MIIIERVFKKKKRKEGIPKMKHRRKKNKSERFNIALTILEKWTNLFRFLGAPIIF